jgi:type IV pilus assembly protein PilB
VSLIIAQRLARRLCPNCKQPLDLPHDALLREGFSEEQVGKPDFKIYKAVGCAQCTDGYKGRVGIYEVLPVSEPIGRIILGGGSAPNIRDEARKEGVWDLRTSGLKKVLDGQTSLEEVNRVTVE